jgi:DNA-binding XRE family transcriptional regulator
MARKKQPPIAAADKELIGSLLRDLRKGAGYRSVETAASREACPASRQTIYAYERGDLVPSLPQFLELVEFYVLEAPHGRGAKPEPDLRSQGVAAVAHALTLEAYHVPHALELVARMRPEGKGGA